MTLYAQDHWAFYDDDADEDTSTIVGTHTTGQTLDVDTTYQARQVVYADAAHSDKSVQWDYSHNSGTWTPAATTASVVRAVASSYITNETASTQRLSSGTYVSTNDWALSNDYLTTSTTDFAGSDYCETVFTFEIVGDDVSDGDTIELRAYNTQFTIQGTLDITVNKPGGASRRIFVTG